MLRIHVDDLEAASIKKKKNGNCVFGSCVWPARIQWPFLQRVRGPVDFRSEFIRDSSSPYHVIFDPLLILMNIDQIHAPRNRLIEPFFISTSKLVLICARNDANKLFNEMK